MKADLPIIVITGPTASGKTKLAIDCAKKFNAEIICADSRAVYKNLDIVSAKPTKEQRQEVVHHLIDIIEPDKTYSAGDFIRDAKAAVNKIKESGKNIIICGGTWFYIKAFLDEKALPKIKSDTFLRKEFEALDNGTLWEKLNSLDPKRAQEIHYNNKERVIRAIEMCLALKMPISEYKRERNLQIDSIWFAKNIDREILYERINKRVDLMVYDGLYQEWQKLKNLYPNSEIIKNTIGYKEFFDLENSLYKNFDESVLKIKQHTRNFAKRQNTYFKSEKRLNFIDTVNNIEDFIKNRQF